MKLTITESEREQILNQHSQLKNSDPVFDFVLTENNKYLIFMDEVFVSGGNGNSIGSIWENTHIFNEIISESLKIKNVLTEEIESKINEITWLKEDVRKWISEKTEITENWFSDNWKKSWDNLKDGKDAIASAFKGDVLPFLRWVRRMAMTNIGIVIDIVASILTVKGSVAIWLIIAALDIYEIFTGDYDPKDPDRQQLPYFYLIMDLLSAVFTAAAGGLFKASIKTITKKGVTNPRIAKWLISIAEKVPWLSKQIKVVIEAMSKKFNNSAILKKLISGIDVVLNKLVEFIKRLTSKAAGDAVKTGVKSGAKVIAVNKGLEYGLNKTGAGNYVGEKIGSLNNSLSNVSKKISGNKNFGEVRIDPNEYKTLEKYLKKYGKI